MCRVRIRASSCSILLDKALNRNRHDSERMRGPPLCWRRLLLTWKSLIGTAEVGLTKYLPRLALSSMRPANDGEDFAERPSSKHKHRTKSFEMHPAAPKIANKQSDCAKKLKLSSGCSPRLRIWCNLISTAIAISQAKVFFRATTFRASQSPRSSQGEGPNSEMSSCRDRGFSRFRSSVRVRSSTTKVRDTPSTRLFSDSGCRRGERSNKSGQALSGMRLP